LTDDFGIYASLVISEGCSCHNPAFYVTDWRCSVYFKNDFKSANKSPTQVLSCLTPYLFWPSVQSVLAVKLHSIQFFCVKLFLVWFSYWCTFLFFWYGSVIGAPFSFCCVNCKNKKLYSPLHVHFSWFISFFYPFIWSSDRRPVLTFTSFHLPVTECNITNDNSSAPLCIVSPVACLYKAQHFMP